MKIAFAFLAFVINYSTVSAQLAMQDLSDKNWQFKELSNTNWRPGTVPGTVHTDLMAVKALGDPFFRDNEKWVQWVSNLDWVYKSEFELNPNVEFKEHIDLVFKGLDTYAEVFLNGKSILKAENMFLEYRIDVKKMLVKGSNVILVVFTSPLKAALPDLAANPQTLPAINDAMPLHTSPYTRKAGYHYGWDWGPRLVTSGIWRPVFLEAWNATRIEDIYMYTRKLEGKSATISGHVKLQNDKPGIFQFELLTGKNIESITLKDSGKGIAHPFEFKIDNAELWWTNGLGNPYLYDVKASLSANKKILDQKKLKFGVRTIEVLHEKDAGGKSFFLKLNGRPVFMKGANYIPQDNFLNRVGVERYLQTLTSAKTANMNMLRVWGGGIYENDVFYQLCDSLGILLWQDFMFACTMYPGTQKFKNLVTQEIRQNVQRLRNHASVALWCGNNENETGWLKRWMMGGIPYSKADSTKIYQDHKVLFHKVIPEIVKQEDPSRFYTRSSPTANDDEIRPDKIGFGDIHDWFVWFGTGDYRKYKNNVSRFQSEYGYQSFPAMESIKRFSEVQDWYEDSDVMDVHQKHPNGNSKIRKFSAQFYQKPKDFESFTYISQLQQAEAMKFAIETHRSRMPYCMGSLYWQLNDCWPAASWSSIDYYGIWKATQYFARKANEPLALFSKLTADSVAISIVNESLKSFLFQGFEVVWKDFSGKELSRQEILIPKGNVTDNMVWNKTLALKKTNWSSTDSASVFIQVRAISNSANASLSDHLFYKLPRDLKLVKTEVNPALEKINSGYRLKIKSPTLIKNLYISSKRRATHFSDNYFDLLPGEEKLIEFDSKESISISDLSFKMLVNE